MPGSKQRLRVPFSGRVLRPKYKGRWRKPPAMESPAGIKRPPRGFQAARLRGALSSSSIKRSRRRSGTGSLAKVPYISLSPWPILNWIVRLSLGPLLVWAFGMSVTPLDLAAGNAAGSFCLAPHLGRRDYAALAWSKYEIVKASPATLLQKATQITARSICAPDQLAAQTRLSAQQPRVERL